MAATATFTADFTKWNSALADAKAGLKSFEVTGKGVQAQLERVAKGFSGVQIKQQAGIAVAAVEKIGGVTKLTAAEQRKLNTTVSEAIAKYHALGQSAPADLVRIEKETRKAATTTQSLAGTFSGMRGLIAGAFTVGAVTALVRDVVALSGELTDLSARTGIGTKALQEFKFAGSQVGVSLEAITTAVGQMQKRVAGGDDSAEAALRKLGLSVKAFRELRPEEQFQAVADKIAAIEDPAARAKLAMDIMGRGALEVMPLLVGGLSALREEAHRLGLVLSEDTIANLEQFGDSMEALSMSGKAAIANALVPLIPALKDLSAAAIEGAKWIGGLGTALQESQLWFQEFLSVMAGWIAAVEEGGVAVLKLQKTLNPLANITGNVDAAIQEFTEDAKKWRYVANDLAENVLVQLVKQQTQHVDVLKRAAPAILDVAKADKDAGKAAKEHAEEIKRLAEEYLAVREQVFRLDEALDRAQLAEDVRELNVELGELKDQLRQVDNIVEEAFDWGSEVDAAIADIRRVDDAIQDTFEKAAEEAKTFGDIFTEEMTKAIGSISDIIVQGLLEGASFEQVATAVGSKVGGAIGAAVGGFVGGPVGAAIGEAIGSALGPAIGKWIKTDAERAAEELGREWGVAISENLSKQIEQTMKTTFEGMRNNRWMAEVLHLGDIIDEVGITEDNFSSLLGQMRQAFVFLDEGSYTGAQAVQVLNESFGKFVDFLGGNVTPALKEIIKLNDDFGLHSEAIAQYVDAEANKALGALTNIISSRGAVADAFAEAQKKLDQLKAKGGSADDIKKATAEVAKLQAQLAALPLTAGGAEALGASLFGIFERLTKDGAPALEVIKQIDPLIESLDRQLQQAGLSGGAAFDTIKSMAALATDELTGPALQAIADYGTALEGLNNANILTPEMFAGIADQVGATVAQLEAQGKTAQEIYPLIGNSLQTIWELQQDYGYAVDETTQKLLDQAEADGVVGDTHRSVQEQMLLASQRMVEVLEAMATTFGVTLPAAAQAGATGIQTAFDGITPPDVTIPTPEVPPIPDFPPIGIGHGDVLDPEAVDELQRQLDEMRDRVEKGLPPLPIGDNGGVIDEETRRNFLDWLAEMERQAKESGGVIAENIQTALDHITFPTIPSGAESPESQPGGTTPTPARQFGSPGFVPENWGRESLVRLHGREAVVREDQRLAAASAWGAGEGGTTINITYTIHAVDGESVRRVVQSKDFIDAQTDTLRRNHRGARTETLRALGVA